MRKKKKGFIKKINLAKLKSEQNTDRFAVKEKIDAKVIKKQNKDGLYELSVKDLEIQEEKAGIKRIWFIVFRGKHWRYNWCCIRRG